MNSMLTKLQRLGVNNNKPHIRLMPVMDSLEWTVVYAHYPRLVNAQLELENEMARQFAHERNLKEGRYGT